MRITTTADFPKFDGRELRNSFQQTMLDALETVSSDEVETIQSQTPYPSISSAYGLVPFSTSSIVGWGITNTNPIWPFREYDTRPHPIPHAFGRDGVVQHPGTKGNYILTNTHQAYRPRIDQAIQGAFYAWVLDNAVGAR